MQAVLRSDFVMDAGNSGLVLVLVPRILYEYSYSPSARTRTSYSTVQYPLTWYK